MVMAVISHHVWVVGTAACQMVHISIPCVGPPCSHCQPR